MVDKILFLLKSRSQILVTIGVIALFFMGIFGVMKLEAFFKNWLEYVTVQEYRTDQERLRSEMKDMIREENRQLLKDFETLYHGRRRAHVPTATEDAEDVNELALGEHFERELADVIR